NARIQANTDSIDALRGRTREGLKSVNNRLNDSLMAVSLRTADSLRAIDARFDDIDKYDERDSARVNFAFGKATLTDSAKRALDDLAARAPQTVGYMIEVRGYADEVGRSSYNLDLSERRAEAVVQYLAAHGNIPIRRVLNPTGFGEEDPVAPNDTAA